MSAQLDQIDLRSLESVDGAVSLVSNEDAFGIASQEVPRSARELQLFGPYWSQVILSTVPLLLGDLLALGVALGCGYGLTSWLSAGGSVDFGWLLLLTGSTMPATFALFGLYPGTGLKALAELGQVALATALLFAVFLILAITNGVGTTTMLTFIVAAIGLMAIVPLFRNVTRWLASSFDWWGQPALDIRRRRSCQTSLQLLFVASSSWHSAGGNHRRLVRQIS